MTYFSSKKHLKISHFDIFYKLEHILNNPYQTTH